jgi:phenylalanyl-tRNA synthetase beta chain
MTRRLLAGQGFDEVLTYSLMAPSRVQLAQPWSDQEPVQVRNPVSVDRTHLRLTNMANLLAVKRFNQSRNTTHVSIYELGRVYLPRADAELPEEKLCLTLLADGDDAARKLKGVLRNLMDELGVEAEIEEVPGAAGPFGQGESVELRLGGELLGCVGIASKEVTDEFDLRNRPSLMEVDFRQLAGRCRPDRPYRPVPAYPATSRDMAVVVDESVLWADLIRCVRQNAPETLESVELVDVYRGKPVPTGSKSVAFSLTFRRHDQTITAAEAEEAHHAILAALGRELGAQLRG